MGGRALVRLLAAGLVLAACGSGGDSETTTSAASTATTTTTVAVVSTGPENSELTVADLIGEWRALPPRSILHLNEDGTYRIALGLTTVEQGQFTLEGTRFTVISNEDSRNCAEGQRGSYEMEVLEDGPSGEDRLKQIQVEEECTIRGSEGDVILERVS